MFISNGAGNELINTALVERFRIVEKPDACLIVASYGQDCDPVTAARYGTLKEAQEALRELFAEIEGDAPYCMPRNTGTYKPNSGPQNGYHGKKHSSHGGS